ncbi:cysteine proteinase inhibitor 5-like [Nicotiana tomentosiformis]|uniref:Cysteine proteinase inhibitor 5-like n=1 Tax=Nicotiana tabacum TaxID=4097 RepID=A0A1S4AFC6_TOBAC|nr:cysteine proteinase inhibitor 5-like [Nicotiana tomentosiformis]XP_016475390.1 PREDICTED: cysteine proteinase inhibitor 5-like [Nicotiana tabacum]
MALKFTSFPFTIFIILVIASTFFHISSAKGGLKREFFIGLTIKDPKVVEIANFAINEFNKKAGHNYILKQVDGVETVTFTSGTNYELFITVNEWDTISGGHVAVVFVGSNNFKKLISFDGKFSSIKN